MYIRLRHLWERFTAASPNASAIPGSFRISNQSVHNRLRDTGITARPLVNAVVDATSSPKQIPVVSNAQSMTTAALENSLVQWRVTISATIALSKCTYFFVFSGDSVMMWAAIYYTGRTNLVQVQGTLTAQIYCDVILQPHVHPIIHPNGVIFPQDNARPNTTRLTTAFFQTHNIAVLPLPSKSLYLNHIEYPWDELDSQKPYHNLL
jgi:hypothetical protein